MAFCICCTSFLSVVRQFGLHMSSRSSDLSWHEINMILDHLSAGLSRYSYLEKNPKISQEPNDLSAERLESQDVWGKLGWLVIMVRHNARLMTAIHAVEKIMKNRLSFLSMLKTQGHRDRGNGWQARCRGIFSRGIDCMSIANLRNDGGLTVQHGSTEF